MKISKMMLDITDATQSAASFQVTADGAIAADVTTYTVSQISCYAGDIRDGDRMEHGLDRHRM
jgi:hypothetical protein